MHNMFVNNKQIIYMSSRRVGDLYFVSFSLYIQNFELLLIKQIEDVNKRFTLDSCKRQLTFITDIYK